MYLSLQCDAGKAINALYDMLYTEPTKHIIVGPACSVEAEVTALAASAWNITHVSYHFLTVLDVMRMNQKPGLWYCKKRHFTRLKHQVKHFV